MNSNQSNTRVFCSVIIILFCFTSLKAQELEPRSYTNIPVGLNFMVAGYAFTSGGILFDPTIPLENANIRIHGSFLAYARSLKIGPMSGKVDLIMPYAVLSGSADFQGQPVSREVSGLGDPRIRFSLNFVGSPAVSLSEFRDYKQDLIIGTSLQVYMPLSQYDPEKLVNIGTNRFTFKPELGISRAFSHLSLELATGVTFFTVNNDFYGGKSRSQDPIGSIQAHAVYSFKGGIWLSFDGNYYWGGATTVDGIKGDDLQENSRFGLTFALPLNIHHSLKLHLSTGVSTRTGSDFDIIGLAWQYRWGRQFPD